MRPDDQRRFQAAMAAMAEVFGKEVSAQLVTLYWDAFRQTCIEQFEGAAKIAISTMRFFPKPGDLRKLIDESNATNATHKAPPELPQMGTWGQRIVDAMLLKWLERRRIEDKFQGDLNVVARRDECRRLSADLDEMLAEDLKPELGEIREMFRRSMARVDAKDKAA